MPIERIVCCGYGRIGFGRTAEFSGWKDRIHKVTQHSLVSNLLVHYQLLAAPC